MLIEARPPPYENRPGKSRQTPPSNYQSAITPSRCQHEDQIERSASPASSQRTNRKPLDLAQKLERKLAEYNASENIFKRWLFELLSWLTSAVCMAAIISIYIWVKDKPVLRTSNFLTYTNVLGKVASAALIVPTSEALGQLKWNWFQSSKAMWDFEIFDKASRGPLGAALLLYRTKGRSLAALGALLIVLMLAIDTFFQQVVDLPQRQVLLAGSLIPRVVQYKPEYLIEYFQGLEQATWDTWLYPTVRPFLYSNGTQPVAFGNGTRPDIPLSCPTSTCNWPAYETLGVCSACTDASDLLEYKCLYTKIDWTTSHTGKNTPGNIPNGTVCGYFYNSENRGPFLMSGYIVNDTQNSQTSEEALLVRIFPFTELTTRLPISNGSVKFKHVRNPIIDALIVSSASSEDVYNRKPPVAQECVLSWCVKTLESSYESGQYRENIISTYENTTRGSYPWDSEKLPEVDGDEAYWVIYNQNVTVVRQEAAPNASDAVIHNDVYKVDNTSVTNAQLIFENIFPSYTTDHGPSGKPMFRYKDFIPGPSFRELTASPWQTPNNVSRHLERLAIAMTNTMRSLANVEMLPGAAYGEEIYVRVKWEWLSFPLILLLLSLVFLVATITKTSGDGAANVWKTSAMPTLIYSLPKEAQGQFTSSSTWVSGQENHKKTRIKLLPNLGWRVSGHDQLISRSPRLPSGARVPRGWI